ncbi:hypothetical protein B0H21DRAFT_348005 [Amylocystis lapponica]|nr:hypothetical protein B0H21DRAFT_348005 [Amylocystis lapponica]
MQRYLILVGSHQQHVLVVVTRACLIASDAIVLLVTWANTYKIKKHADRIDVKAPLVTLLLRDGTLYFLLLLLLNILHMALYLANIFVDMIYFIGPISSVIMSRFLLNLRQVYLTDNIDETRTSTRSNVSDMRFAASFVGNLGAPLSYGESRTFRPETTRSACFSNDGIVSPADSGGFDLVDSPQTAKNPLSVDMVPAPEGIELNSK